MLAVKEAGLMQRTVVVEFDNLGQALAAYDRLAYKEALAVLVPNAAERDIVIVAAAE